MNGVRLSPPTQSLQPSSIQSLRQHESLPGPVSAVCQGWTASLGTPEAERGPPDRSMARSAFENGRVRAAPAVPALN